MAMTGGGQRQAAMSVTPERRGRARRRRADRRGAAVDLPARRRHHHAAAHGDVRLPGRRAGRAGHRPRPDRHLQGDLRRHRAELAVPVDAGRRPHDRGDQPAADADPDDAADPHRPGRRVRVPLRAVQHRRPGPVHHRLDPGRLDRLVLRGHAGLPHIVLCIARRLPRRRGVGGDRGRAEGDRRRQRGDLDDHAQLDRDLGRRLRCSASAARCRTTSAAAVRAGLQRHRRRARSCRSSGATRSCRACTSASSSRSPALLVFWVLLNRTTTGYEVRAVGFNPDAARPRASPWRATTSS